MPPSEHFTYEDCLARADDAEAHAMGAGDVDARRQYSGIAVVWNRLAASVLRHRLKGIASPAN